MAASHGRLIGRKIVSVHELDVGDVRSILEVATRMGRYRAEGVPGQLRKRVLACLFYDMSAQAYLSFASAMEYLGGRVISCVGPEYAQLAKGEAIEDVVRTAEAYADLVVLCHPDHDAVVRAARVLQKPFINAGGAAEHPTQALIDLYAISRHPGLSVPRTVTFVGDMTHGSVQTLAGLLAKHGRPRLQFVSPKALRLESEVLQSLQGKGFECSEPESLREALEITDVLYVTPFPQGRPDTTAYAITKECVQLLPEHAAILHPFPRSDELPMEVDEDHRAFYFKQMEYGLHVRMALLAMLLGKA